MSKTRRSSRATQDRSATTDIVSQIECAIRHPQATLIGALIGGVVPWFARTLAHEQVPAAWSAGNFSLVAIMVAVVLGCALFSALTVYKFGRAAFGDAKKALGFTLALEGVMLVASGGTSVAALAVLIAINALANGSVIALAREATCKHRAAVARGAATRARSRAARSPVTIPVASTAPARPTSSSTALIKTPRWNPAMSNDVIDAEIVSEELFS
jgi:hypothetical protein